MTLNKHNSGQDLFLSEEPGRKQIALVVGGAAIVRHNQDTTRHEKTSNHRLCMSPNYPTSMFVRWFLIMLYKTTPTQSVTIIIHYLAFSLTELTA